MTDESLHLIQPVYMMTTNLVEVIFLSLIYALSADRGVFIAT